MFKAGKMFAMAVLAAGVLAGCGTATVAPGPIAAQGPEWVNKGSGAFNREGQAVFYGVGIAQGIKNRALSVEAADSRARAEIAKTMETYVASLTKSYMASTTAGAMDKSSEEQHVQNTLKTFTQKTLSGVEIVDHWKDPSDGTMFALAKLDLAGMKAMLDNAKELDGKLRDFVRANADKAFDDLKAEEAAHSGK